MNMSWSSQVIHAGHLATGIGRSVSSPTSSSQMIQTFVHSTTTDSLFAAAAATAATRRASRDPENYEKIDQIGKGAYGTVFKAINKQNGNVVALKTMRFALTEDGVPMAILREISLLKQLARFNHPNIVQLLDITHGQVRDRQMSLHLIFEHVHQDLSTYIENCPAPGLSEYQIKKIFYQILSGVDFLHSHRIVHRDLKPQNLLVTKEGVVKLTDFGLARIYDFYTLLTSVVVTLWYRAPEVLMGTSYATPVDLWACGCIFAELYLTKPLFAGQYEMDQLNRIFDIVGLPPENDWPSNVALLRSNFRAEAKPQNLSDIIPEIDSEGLDLLKKMLDFVPSRRISAADALRHVYFAGMEDDEYSSFTSASSSSVRSPMSPSSFSVASSTIHHDSSVSSSTF